MEEWYYAQEGRQVGPVTRKEIQQLIYAKQINADTLVWKEGMADWQKLGNLSSQKAEIKEKADPAEPKEIPAEYSEADAESVTEEDSSTEAEQRGPVLKQKAETDITPSPQIICSRCGGSFPQNEMFRYQGISVCTACKPLFIQKLKEDAVSVPDEIEYEYGGFWIRLGAKIIDGIAVGIIQVIVSFPLGLLLGLSESSDSLMLIGQGVNLLFSLILPIIYTTWFLGTYAATPGKMACSLRVVSAYGERISYARAFGRTMAEWLSSLILCIGYLMAAFDEEKRTLHDRICNTRVIRI
ncbi:MAG: RDD family protein [Desulfococcaceae bacterium]